MNPLLSILIPTKDRYKTLIPVINGLVTDFSNANVEFIIQDNTESNDAIKHFLNDLSNEKIKYFHNPTAISVTENCDLAIKNASGKYLIMIGDDDYVLPSIISSITWMENNDVECLNSNTATYYWPDLSFKYQTRVSNSASLLLKTPLTKEYMPLNPISELTKVIKSGGTDFANLPRLYHGLVNRIVLDRIFDKCKTYFPGPSPDMANSTALAIFTNKFYIYNFPFSISGKSTLSASGMGLNHTHVGNLDEKLFLDKKLIAQWNKKIPYFWSGDTIYAQSLSHALNVCNFNARINFTRLYAHLFVFERSSVMLKLEPVSTALKSNPFIIFPIIYWYFVYSKNRMFNYLLRKILPNKNCQSYKKVHTIERSCEIISNL